MHFWFSILFLVGPVFLLRAQRQLDIQGVPTSTDTVVTIRVNNSDPENVVGLAVHAEPQVLKGVGGSFYGGLTGISGSSTLGVGVSGISASTTGVFGSSDGGQGVFGYNTTGTGVLGTSISGTGAYFRGGNGIAVELAGQDSPWGDAPDDGVIVTRQGPGGDMILVSNDVVAIHLDDDQNSASTFTVHSGDNTAILNLNESGNLSITGTCACSSDVHRKENFQSVDVHKILGKVVDLPLLEWQFKSESSRHIGPMAQDFYQAFGLGGDETKIATVDSDGIALASIQALAEENQILRNQLRQLGARLKMIEQVLSEFRN